MADFFDIPEGLRGTFQRMLNLAPEPLRVDTGFRQLTLLHLKVGGERLARCNTQLFRFRLEEELIFGRNFLEDKQEENTNVEKDTDAGEDEETDADAEDDDFEDESLDDDESDDDTDSDDDAEDRLALSDWNDFPSVRSIWADGIDC